MVTVEAPSTVKLAKSELSICVAHAEVATQSGPISATDRNSKYFIFYIFHHVLNPLVYRVIPAIVGNRFMTLER